MRHFKKTYKSKSYHLDSCCYWKIRHHTFFRCKIVFIHFALFLIFTLWDQTLSRYSDNESNYIHFLIFWKISDGCFYIRISSISDVKLKFVFSRTAMTISSAKYIRAFLRWIIIGFFILCCISSYFSLTYEAVRINDYKQAFSLFSLKLEGWTQNTDCGWFLNVSSRTHVFKERS